MLKFEVSELPAIQGRALNFVNTLFAEDYKQQLSTEDANSLAVLIAREIFSQKVERKVLFD